ncbi:hypothetical protein GcM1_073001 [Golovinomyces cichoracearum]|uniref:Uncharacterized protein n=1 Tax=Golovinomyces cichoracearum TaxID=62708 RepID=A0A420JCG4_9PEZI|nr:hypothetical protein GcM1_073001 [Golovinomyces cichoracearum]
MDQTLHYPNIFNRNSTSTLNIEPAISAPGEFHPYILSNEMQEFRYDPQRIALTDLREIIRAAWDEVPDEFITKLYDSWWDRCKAVIDAEGGVTKY